MLCTEVSFGTEEHYFIILNGSENLCLSWHILINDMAF